MAPWFQRLESDRDASGPHHGRDGPVPISRYRDQELIPIQRAIRDGCLSAGFARIEDHNALEGSGVGPWPMNRAGDTRMSTALCHLRSARARGNLTIRAGAIVDRFAPDGTRVVGIRLADGTEVSGGHVVLAAGAINSPAILMRSGIGPRAHLEALGIATRLDRPVGTRLRDHAAVPIRLVPHPGECVIGRDPRFQVLARFTAPGSPEPDDMQLVLTSHMNLAATPALQEEAGVPVVAALRVALMVPRGHGRLTLASRDPLVQPRIELNFCADAEDLRRLIAGVRLAWRVLRSDAMKGAYQRVAGLDGDIVASDSRLTAYIRANIGTYCHAQGTAPMGPDGDPDAVVDQRGRVCGVDNLTVGDASILPAVPRAVINFTVMMIGERVARWLAES